MGYGTGMRRKQASVSGCTGEGWRLMRGFALILDRLHFYSKFTDMNIIALKIYCYKASPVMCIFHTDEHLKKTIFV